MMLSPMHRALSSGRSRSTSMNSSGNTMPRSRVMRYRKPLHSSLPMWLSASSTPTIIRASGVVQLPTAVQKVCTGPGRRQPVTSSTSMATVEMLAGVIKLFQSSFSPGRNRLTT